jgi:uncharacterized protein YkwD
MFRQICRKWQTQFYETAHEGHTSMNTSRLSIRFGTALTAALLTNGAAVAQTSPTPDQLFNWAESTYSTLFPAGPTSQVIAQYTVRAYTTGNYLGIADGRLYALGPITANQLLDLGPVSQFTCQVLPTAAGCPGAPVATDQSTCDLPNFQTDLLNIVNQHRAAGAQCGSSGSFAPAPALVWNTTMGIAALGHSNDMQQRNFFSHTGSDGSNPGARLTSAGYNWRTYGENIAAGQATIQSVVSGWMNSPGHCANIMKASFREIAVACVKGTNANTYRTYWTMVLGTAR